MELLLNNRCYYLSNCQGVVFMGLLSVSLQKFYRCWVGVFFFFFCQNHFQSGRDLLSVQLNHEMFYRRS